MTTLAKATVEQAVFDWISGLGSAVAHDITPNTPRAARRLPEPKGELLMLA